MCGWAPEAGRGERLVEFKLSFIIIQHSEGACMDLRLGMSTPEPARSHAAALGC